MFTFESMGETYTCREVHDIVGTSTNSSGVEISNNGKVVGVIEGLSIPDETDEDEVDKFEVAVECWIAENN